MNILISTALSFFVIVIYRISRHHKILLDPSYEKTLDYLLKILAIGTTSFIFIYIFTEIIGNFPD